MTGTTYDRQAAEDYRAAREIPRSGLEAWRTAVAAAARLGPGMTLLDVGAGTGAFAAAFHDWYGVEVLAVEPAEAMRALIPVSAAIRALDGRAEALPVEDGWADVVISNGVINLCADKQAVFAEIFRVLRPGGRLQFADIANGRPVPAEALRDIDLWTG